jgi:hypothetical protein
VIIFVIHPPPLRWDAPAPPAFSGGSGGGKTDGRLPAPPLQWHNAFSGAAPPRIKMHQTTVAANITAPEWWIWLMVAIPENVVLLRMPTKNFFERCGKLSFKPVAGATKVSHAVISLRLPKKCGLFVVVCVLHVRRVLMTGDRKGRPYRYSCFFWR